MSENTERWDDEVDLLVLGTGAGAVRRLAAPGDQPVGCQPSAGPSFVAMSVRICT